MYIICRKDEKDSYIEFFYFIFVEELEGYVGIERDGDQEGVFCLIEYFIYMDEMGKKEKFNAGLHKRDSPVTSRKKGRIKRINDTKNILWIFFFAVSSSKHDQIK